MRPTLLAGRIFASTCLLIGLGVTVPTEVARAGGITSSPGLCAAGHDERMPVPWTLRVSKVHGTSDWKADSNGYSLRTCWWKGQRGQFWYQCPSRNNAQGWELHLVSAREVEETRTGRWKFPLVCDGRRQYISYYGMDPNWRLHVHLHDAGDCNPDRRWPLPDRQCPTLGSVKLHIEAPSG